MYRKACKRFFSLSLSLITGRLLMMGGDPKYVYTKNGALDECDKLQARLPRTREITVHDAKQLYRLVRNSPMWSKSVFHAKYRLLIFSCSRPLEYFAQPSIFSVVQVQNEAQGLTVSHKVFERRRSTPLERMPVATVATAENHKIHMYPAVCLRGKNPCSKTIKNIFL